MGWLSIAHIDVGETSEVLIGRGLPDELLPERHDREQTVVFYQPPVRDYAERVAARIEGVVKLRELEDREAAKDLEAVRRVYEWLAGENLGRHDTIVGVGGGAATDAAGFIAATWMRGVEAVMVPTTLLGAVDAALGGKTAANVWVSTPSGRVAAKNLVGVFWHPRRVIIDLDLLESLPTELRLEGTAEALKAGLVGDPELVSLYERRGGEAPLDLVVPAAVRVKARVVADDFRERGRRAVLNLGHTVGHAVEALTGMPHGYAVAVGMASESVVSRHRFGFDQEWLTELIFSLGLPVAAAGVSMDAALGVMYRDKKRQAEGVRLVALRAVGWPEVVTASADELVACLRTMGAG